MPTVAVRIESLRGWCAWLGEFLPILDELIVCSYAAPNATSEAGKHVLIPRMADRGKNDVASTTETLVRLAVVEQITDAVNRVLE
jgi:hypothetical protein